MINVFTGFSYFWRACRLLACQPRLWFYIAAPIAINALVGFILYITLLLAGLRAIATLLAGWPEWLAWLLQILLVIVLLMAIGYLLVRFGVVLGSPFYSRLSEILEEQIRGVRLTAPPPTITGMLRDLGRALLFELKKLLLTLSIALPALLFNLIPVVGTFLATVSWTVLGAIIACLDFYDPPLERQGLGFCAKLAFIRRHLPTSANFGLICLTLTSIPLLNLFAIPVCITAGTLFYLDTDEARGSV